VLASVLVLPVGIGIVAATAGTVLVLAGGLFPVPSAAQVPETVIALTARAAVVTGAVAAVFGATTATRGVLDADTLEDATTTAVRTAVVPFCLAILLAGNAALQFLESNAAGPGIQTIIGDVLRAITSLFFRPDPLGPHLPTFAVMAGVALLAAHRGVRALPITELLAENGTGDEYRERIEAGQRGCSGRASPSSRRSPSRPSFTSRYRPASWGPRSGRAVRRRARGHRQSHAPLAGLVAVGSPPPASSGCCGASSRAPDRIGSVLAPFAGGVAIVALAFAVSDTVLFEAVAWVAGQLPGQFSTQFRNVVTP